MTGIAQGQARCSLVERLSYCLFGSFPDDDSPDALNHTADHEAAVAHLNQMPRRPRPLGGPMKDPLMSLGHPERVHDDGSRILHRTWGPIHERQTNTVSD